MERLPGSPTPGGLPPHRRIGAERVITGSRLKILHSCAVGGKMSPVSVQRFRARGFGNFLAEAKIGVTPKSGVPFKELLQAASGLV